MSANDIEPGDRPSGSQPDDQTGHAGQSSGQSYGWQPYSQSPDVGQPHGAGHYGQPPSAGQPYAGQPYAGQPYAGQPHPGQSYAGQPDAGQPYGGQPYAGQPYYGSYYGPYAPLPPASPSRARGRRRTAATGLGLVVAGAVVGAGVVLATSDNTGTSSQASSSGASGGTTSQAPGGTTNQLPGGTTGQLPGGSIGQLPGGATGQIPGQGSSTATGTAASTKQSVGVVTVVSVLKYQNAESAGTGMVLTSNGEVLTNNHVINGATSVTVRVVSTGRSYAADVVGTDPSDDVAVLKLRNASGLATAALGSGGVSTGDRVTGVGNAGGTGRLRAAAGKVTALKQTITASDETGSDSERLDGLIQIDAPIMSGDSGGPLYDAAGKVIGMDTAASATYTSASSTTSAYAIPIQDALTIAQQIEKGVQTATIHIGLPGFIGVGVDDTGGSGAAITSVLSGGPAARAGITAGSVITSVGGKQIRSSAGLKAALTGGKPGASVRIVWMGADGAQHSASVQLAQGPAD